MLKNKGFALLFYKRAKIKKMDITMTAQGEQIGGAVHNHTEDQDGWQATTSDEEDYLRLTQSYVDGCPTSLTSPGVVEDDVFVKKEDDIGQKEDDRMESDSSDEDIYGGT